MTDRRRTQHIECVNCSPLAYGSPCLENESLTTGMSGGNSGFRIFSKLGKVTLSKDREVTVAGVESPHINCSGDNQHVTMQRNGNRESGEFYFQAPHGSLALPVVEMLQKKPIRDKNLTPML